jgi:hypothetical protein
LGTLLFGMCAFMHVLIPTPNSRWETHFNDDADHADV